jgi:hypothetical protein
MQAHTALVAVAGFAWLNACTDSGGGAGAADDAGSPDAAADGAASAWKAPRTAWGDPDLQGMWPIDKLNGTPLQRPESFGDRRLLTDEEFAERTERLAGLNARYDNEIKTHKMGIGHWAEMGQPNRLTSLIVEPANGRLPALTPEGERRSATMTSSWSNIPFDKVSDFNPLDRCITRGLPASMFPFMYNSGIEIVQSPGYVVIRLELVHETRIVPVDGRPALSPAIHHWLGESRGRWEGDTLVVDVTNFSSKTDYRGAGETLHLVERFTRTPNGLRYEVSVDDPHTWTKRWTAALDMTVQPEPMFEYACHEGNNSMRNILSGARAAER